MDLYRLGAWQLRELLKKREVSPLEVVKALLQRIKEKDGRINAFLTVDEEGALEQARRSEALIQDVEQYPLAGVPVGIKDVLVTWGLRTTAGSRMLENFVPPYDATAVKRLKEAGAIIIGKLNMDEFAMGSSNENSAFGPVHNPYDLQRVPGGSSGGSAAAVAAGLVPVALGSDTGGSIRQPAAFCGIVGLKPTYGRVSRFGLIAFASSLDQVGPMTRNVRDAALLYRVISGHDPADSTSAQLPPHDVLDVVENSQSLKGLKIAVPWKELEGADEIVKDRFERVVETLRSLGAEVGEVEMPSFRYAVAVYYIIAPSEASSNLARYDGVKYGLRIEGEDLVDTYFKTRGRGFGREVKRRIMLGTYALSAGYYDAYYLKAQRVRTLIKQDFENVFAEHDLVIMPTSPTPAFKIGEKIQDPLTMYLNDIFTIPANLAGVPAISLPCGFSPEGLPVGFQFMGPLFKEDVLFAAAAAYEKARGEYFNRVAEI